MIPHMRYWENIGEHWADQFLGADWRRRRRFASRSGFSRGGRGIECRNVETGRT